MSDPVILLERYVNGAILERSDRIWSAIWSGIPFLRHAEKAMYASAALNRQPEAEHRQTCEIQPYEGKNPGVLEVQALLKAGLEEDLLDALAHGSLGTYEEVAYSDFDALVILKEEVFLSRHRLARVAQALHGMRKYMYQVDPLQHHGWFVLSESSLRNFPVLYFPPALLGYSKSLLHSGRNILDIRYSDHHDFSAPLRRLCQSLERKLSAPLPHRLYAVKNLLSEFMLLPALYTQARDRKGMYKKFSFEAARPDFNPVSWQAMEKVSSIREKWATILGEDGLDTSTIHPGSPLPAHLKALLHRECLQGMQRLVKEMKEKIK